MATNEWRPDVLFDPFRSSPESKRPSTEPTTESESGNDLRESLIQRSSRYESEEWRLQRPSDEEPFLRRLANDKTIKTIGITAGAVLILVLVFDLFLSRHPENTEPQAAKRGAPCTLVNDSDVETLRQYRQVTAHSFYNGRPITIDTVLPPQAEVCVLISMPQTELGEYIQGPVRGKGPDSIHMYLNSSTVRMTMPPPLPLEGQGETEVFTPNNIVYQQAVQFLHGGLYELHVDIEYTNWHWAKQWYDDDLHASVHYPTGIEIEYPDMSIRYKEESEIRQVPRPIVLEVVQMFPPELLVAHEHESFKPVCSDRITANRGRWLASFAHDVPGGLVDEWGYVWDGDDCHLQFYTDVDTIDCLAGKSIHVIGDANARRLSKSLISGGRFCHNTTAPCQKDDTGLPTSIITMKKGNNDEEMMDSSPKVDPEWNLLNDTMLEIKFGRSSRLYFGFQRMVSLDWMDWTRLLYDRKYWTEAALRLSQRPTSRLGLFKPDKDLASGAKARQPLGTEKPDVVIVAVGKWDEAFLPFLEWYADALPYFRDAILEAYPDSLIVVRLLHQICCQQNENLVTRYSMTRIQHINDITRSVFKVNKAGTHGMEGRVMILDPEALVGMPDEIRDFGDYMSAHLRYSKVRTEAQLLLNSLCIKDEKSRARWRWIG